MLPTSEMVKSSVSLTNNGRIRVIGLTKAKMKKLVIITEHTGTDVKIFVHGIATLDFFATDSKN